MLKLIYEYRRDYESINQILRVVRLCGLHMLLRIKQVKTAFNTIPFAFSKWFTDSERFYYHFHFGYIHSIGVDEWLKNVDIYRWGGPIRKLNFVLFSRRHKGFNYKVGNCMFIIFSFYM